MERKFTMGNYNLKLKEYHQQTVVSIFNKPIISRSQHDNSVIYLKRFRSLHARLVYDNGDGTGIYECDEKLLTDEKIRVCKEHHLDFYSINYTVKNVYTANIIDDNERQERNLISSLNRTKSKVYDLSYANFWSHFVTLTFNDSLLIDCYGDGSWNYDVCCKALHQYLTDLRRKYPATSYLAVPEHHKCYYNTQTSKKVYFNKTELTEDIYQELFEKANRTQQEQSIVDYVKNGIYKRRFHFHFLFNNFPTTLLTISITKHGKPRKTKSGLTIYNILGYKWGFTTATEISNLAATQSYITKYISKDLISVSKGRKRYWTSSNLQKPTTYKMELSKTERTEIINELSNIVKNDSRKKKTEIKVNDYENTIHKYVVFDKELWGKDTIINDYTNIQSKFDNVLCLNHINTTLEAEIYLNSPFCPLLSVDSSSCVQKKPFTYVYFNNELYTAKLLNEKYHVEKL